MSDDRLNPVPLRHHLIFAGLIAALVAIIAVFFTRVPMECQIGYRLASAGQAQVCVRIAPDG